jgi:hypothetical protein
VAHTLPAAFASGRAGIRGDQSHLAHLPEKLKIVVSAAPCLPVMALPEMNHLVDQRRKIVGIGTRRSPISRIKADFVGNVALVMRSESCRGKETASRPTTLHRDETVPQFASKQLLVEEVECAIKRIVGFHRVGVFVLHSRHPILVPYGTKRRA